eukprot:scaffold25733_cov67-Phaeocystis_antarctica.AAC.1
MAGRWMVADETARVSQGGSTEATLQRERERTLNHQCVRALRRRDAAINVGHFQYLSPAQLHVGTVSCAGGGDGGSGGASGGAGGMVGGSGGGGGAGGEGGIIGLGGGDRGSGGEAGGERGGDSEGGPSAAGGSDGGDGGGDKGI